MPRVLWYPLKGSGELHVTSMFAGRRDVPWKPCAEVGLFADGAAVLWQGIWCSILVRIRSVWFVRNTFSTIFHHSCLWWLIQLIPTFGRVEELPVFQNPSIYRVQDHWWKEISRCEWGCAGGRRNFSLMFQSCGWYDHCLHCTLAFEWQNARTAALEWNDSCGSADRPDRKDEICAAIKDSFKDTSAAVAIFAFDCCGYFSFSGVSLHFLLCKHFSSRSKTSSLNLFSAVFQSFQSSFCLVKILNHFVVFDSVVHALQGSSWNLPVLWQQLGWSAMPLRMASERWAR